MIGPIIAGILLALLTWLLLRLIGTNVGAAFMIALLVGVITAFILGGPRNPYSSQ